MKIQKIQTEIKVIAKSIGFFCASASIVDFGFQPSASADNTYLDLDYSGYHKNLIQ